MKIVFFGSSEFSIPSFKACMKKGREVVYVISTPDKKKGRGLHLSPTPVSVLAKEKGIPFACPAKLRDPELLEKVQQLNPDLFVVASYGKLIPDAWLEIPKILPLNVHPSLLPKYRGAAPINWPLVNGDSQTGVSIAEVTKDLDAGDLFAQLPYKLDATIDSDSLSHNLSELAVEALESVLKKIEKGERPKGKKQGEAGSSYARKLEKDDGKINWDTDAQAIANQVRGFTPWPMAFTFYEGKRLQFLKASAEASEDSGKPGELIEISKKGFIVVSAKNGRVKVERVKPEGKKAMSAADFVRGQRFPLGFRFGEQKA